LAEEIPGFAVRFKGAAGFVASAVRIEADMDVADDLIDGNDVPNVAGHDVGGDKVDFIGGVFGAAAMAVSNGDAITPARRTEDGLDLNAKEASTIFDDEVIGFAVAEGFADRVSEADGTEDEDQFGHFAFAFGVL